MFKCDAFVSQCGLKIEWDIDLTLTVCVSRSVFVPTLTWPGQTYRDDRFSPLFDSSCRPYDVSPGCVAFSFKTLFLNLFSSSLIKNYMMFLRKLFACSKAVVDGGFVVSLRESNILYHNCATSALISSPVWLSLDRRWNGKNTVETIKLYFRSIIVLVNLTAGVSICRSSHINKYRYLNGAKLL